MYLGAQRYVYLLQWISGSLQFTCSLVVLVVCTVVCSVWYKLIYPAVEPPQCPLRPLGKHHCGLDRRPR